MKATHQKEATSSKVSKKAKTVASGQLGLFFNQTRCDGCYACAVACKDWHDIPAGPASWLRVSTHERGKFPNPFLAFKVNLCHHCTHAPCVVACPAEAISKRDKDGIVVVDREKCLGKDKCGHPCSNECPAGNDVMGFVTLAKEGRYAEAWGLLIENNPFPGVCGRVCSHPCESACIRGQADEPIAIHALERFVAEYRHTIPPFTVERKNQRVAVVGSGPAGLSCAYNLAKRGYQVTVFESMPVAGGMLRVGIPEYRLPGVVLDQEIAFIKSVGVEIKTNMQVGKDISLEDLDRFDAVFLAVGAHKERGLKIPGIELRGIIGGLEFLREAKLKGKAATGKKVVVLGGGNVAFDCARSALHLGATDVAIACLESRDKMLATSEEITAGCAEGITIHNSLSFKGIVGENDRVTGVECQDVKCFDLDRKSVV
jgi:NADPH-dependent glutamate synthase beta subunit-like oxidoreductase